MTDPSQPPRPVIRDAVADDVPALVELLRHGALVDRGETPDDPLPYLAALDELRTAANGSALLVADVSDPPGDGTGQPVGMCQLIVVRHFQARGGLCAELESVHVHPAWRGRGIGGVLVETAVARAAAAGCYRAQLTSNVARADAHRFYERHGFTPSHTGFKRLLGH